MKYILTFAIVTSFFTKSYTQQTAVTDSGQVVILYSNGTWKYKNENKNTSWETSLDTVKSNKSADATFLLKGNKINYGIWINPKKWKFKKSDEIDYEYLFSFNEGEAYGFVTPEKIELPLNTYKDIVIKNIQEKTTDLKIIKEDIRIINGNLINSLELTAELNGLKFHYIMYFFSSEIGSIRISALTTDTLFDKYKATLINFLNGFVVLSNNNKNEEIKAPPPPIEKLKP